MNAIKQDQFGAPAPLSVAVDALIFEHGAYRFIWAAFTGLFRAPMIRQEIDLMPDNLRQDIGLAPKGDPARLREFMR